MSVIKTGKYDSHQEYLLQAMQDKFATTLYMAKCMAKFGTTIDVNHACMPATVFNVNR